MHPTPLGYKCAVRSQLCAFLRQNDRQKQISSCLYPRRCYLPRTDAEQVRPAWRKSSYGRLSRGHAPACTSLYQPTCTSLFMSFCDYRPLAQTECSQSGVQNKIFLQKRNFLFNIINILIPSVAKVH